MSQLQQISKRFLALVFSVALILAWGFTAEIKAQSGGTTNEQLAPQKLKTIFKKWKKRSFDSYQYTFQRTCFCLRDLTREVRVTVRNDQIVEIRFTDTGDLVDPSLYQFFYTMREIFKEIRQQLAQDPEHAEIEYDSQWKIPTYVFIDQSSGLADEEIQFVIKDFTPIDN